MKVVILTWDWKENVDSEEMFRAVRDVFEQGKQPSVREVGNTDSDAHALVVASEPITPGQAQQIWDEHWCEYRDNDKWLLTITTESLIKDEPKPKKKQNQQSNNQPKKQNTNQGGNTMSSNTKLQSTVIVKFSLSKRELVPAGIPEKSARERGAHDAKRVGEALEQGTPELAEQGRVRAGVVDTGEQIVEQKNVSALKLELTLFANGYILSDLHWFEKKPSDPRKGKSKFVVCATYTRPADKPTITLGLHTALTSVTWGQVYVWKNPNGTNTINLTGRQPDQRAQYSLEASSGSWVTRPL